MFEWLSSLTDTTGFYARKTCGAWTPEWIALHVGSDILIWLAYLSIPIALLAVARHRALRPLRPSLWLFAAFILACGTTHLIEAVIFERPVYRLSGVAKALTAAVSWVTVFALVMTAGRLIPVLDRLTAEAATAAPPPDDPDRDRPSALLYPFAVLVALLAVLIRYALDPALGDLHAFSISLLAVTFVAWYAGIGPGVVTLVVSGALTLYLFVPPRGSLMVEGLDHQFGVGLFLFTGAAVAVLGQSQRAARRRLLAKVTEAERATAALTASEERFRQLADAMPQIVYVSDPTGRVEYINRRWYETTGQSAADAADNSELIHPDDYPVMVARWEQAVAAGTPYQVEFRMKTVPDGAYRWFLARSVPIRDDAGRVTRWYGTSTDIDDQKRHQRDLQQAAAELRQLTEGMPLLMWACQPTGECDYLSRQWVEYTGRSEADQLPYGWLDSLHPDDRAGTAEAWHAAVAGEASYDIEFRIRRFDGEYRWFAVRGIPLRNPAGRIVRWFGSCTDIEDRKQQAHTLETMVTDRTAALHKATAEAREQRIFLDAILDNVAEGIVACDTGGRLKLFNAATRRMHGLPAEPLPADRWAEHYGLYEADGVTPMPPERVPLARALAGDEVRDAEMLIRAAGQADRYVLCTGVRLRSADGSASGAVVSMRDMTERREYERQLLVTSAALKASNEELEKFAYVASHDLQEPLRKIQAFGTRLADKSRDALGELGKDYIDRMLDSAGRMRRLIEDLLLFARVATKPLPFAPVDLAAVVRDVLHDLEYRLQQTSGTVDVAPLPTVPGDTSQLRQVFQNLLGNALKFARPGVPPVVRVTAVPFADLPTDADPAPPPGPGWRIAVTDNGIGFEQGYAERIFELFQRLHSRSEYDGTGLGLAIVRKIVLRHGASIAARGRPGEGASFLLDWPTRPTLPT